MKRLNLCEGRYVKHILNLHLWFTEQKKLAYLKKKILSKICGQDPIFSDHIQLIFVECAPTMCYLGLLSTDFTKAYFHLT